jgi:3-polyprenyl-4-hydroxybenzoate decarboxylase
MPASSGPLVIAMKPKAKENVVSYAACVVLKESRRLVLPRTSFYILFELISGFKKYLHQTNV